MALPTSRNTTYAPLSQVLSADLNAIQDLLIVHHSNLQMDIYEQAGTDALIPSGDTTWEKAPAGVLPSIIRHTGSDVSTPARWGCPTGASHLNAVEITGSLSGAGAVLDLAAEEASSDHSAMVETVIESLGGLSTLHGGWARAVCILPIPLELSSLLRPILRLYATDATTSVARVRWYVTRWS